MCLNVGFDKGICVLKSDWKNFFELKQAPKSPIYKAFSAGILQKVELFTGSISLLPAEIIRKDV